MRFSLLPLPLILAFGVTAHAETVTLAFEAEIVRVFDTVPFDAGVSFEVGDTITGRFSFEPDDVGGGAGPLTAFESQQSTRAFINVSGVELSTPDEATGITIRSFNNSFSTVFGEVDSIDIGSQLTPSIPSVTPNVTGAGLAVFIQSTSDVLPGAIIPADPTLWNQLINFDDRLRLTLRDDSDGRVGFTAALIPGSFVIVPEPSACSPVLVAALFGSIHLRRIRGVQCSLLHVP